METNKVNDAVLNLQRVLAEVLAEDMPERQLPGMYKVGKVTIFTETNHLTITVDERALEREVAHLRIGDLTAQKSRIEESLHESQKEIEKQQLLMQ